MATFREILTKAVVGKGRRSSVTIHELFSQKEPSRTLGCWVINAQITPYVKGEDLIAVEGQYDIHIWYGIENDKETDIIKRTIEFKEEIPFKVKPGEKLGVNNELRGFFTKYPVCTSLKITDDNKIEVTIDKEIIVDAIGETKLKVQVTQGEEEWIIDGEIEANINPNYVVDKSEQSFIQ